jgi:ferredoxin
VRAQVDSDICAGHGDCVATCGTVFTLTDDGYAEAITGEIPLEAVESARAAAEHCPEHAITIDED